MKKLNATLLWLGTFAASVSFAQTGDFDPSNARAGEAVEYCHQHKQMEKAMQDPELRARYEAEQLESSKNPQTVTPKGIVYTIPIVFHVLHAGGIENISDEQLYDALAILNRDYRLQNADANNVKAEFQGLPADVEIEFALATIAPDGTCFKGITRTYTQETFSGDGQDQVAAVVNGNDVYQGQWPPDEYLNIFICDDIGGAAGYTFNPGNWTGSSMFYNGVFALHNYTGSIGTSNVSTSRTLTHEVGHWLNLSHTWGPNNNPGNASSCGDDDGVSDTPNTIGVTSCNLNESSCGPLANVENYMDYSYCSKMFTPGQKTRMRDALTSAIAGRNNTFTSSNLAAVGANGDLSLCKADFSASKTIVCAGDAVQFNDESYNGASSWNWTFAGGSPATSSSENPVITYANPGTYQVILTASDGTSSLTETKTSFITVLPNSSGLPFYESFEPYTSLASSGKWFVENQNGNQAFEITSSAAYYGSKSVKLQNFSQTGNSTDRLTSSGVDLSGVNSTDGCTMTFRYAYRKKVSANNETLKVFMTNDCGSSWQQRKTLLNNTLGSQTASSSWTPSTQADWTTVHVTNITSQFWVENFRYRFEFDGSGGNNLYIDDINIYEGPPSDQVVLSLEEAASNVRDLELFPNPAEDEINIRFGLETAGTIQFTVVDITGKRVQGTSVNGNSGTNLVLMPVNELSDGVYFVKIEADGYSKTLQFIVR